MHLGYSWTLDETTAGVRRATTVGIKVAHRQLDGGRSHGEVLDLKAFYNILRTILVPCRGLDLCLPNDCPRF